LLRASSSLRGMSVGALCMVLLVSDVISHVGGTTSLPNMEMGEAIADLLKNDLTGKSEAFNSAFQDAVASKQQGLVNPEVSKIQQAANKMAGQMEQLTEADSVCTRDYSKTCPEGWADLGGSKCEAPKAYGGACATLESFQGYSPLQKAAYAEACKAPWPCFGECSEGRDYDHLCPAEWTDIGGGICQAPSTYAGSCLKQYKFDTYTLEKKEQVAHACGFQWPCRAPCVRDYSSACPAGWTELSFSPGMCQAGPTYIGECPFGANMTGTTPEQKAAFESKCSVQYPCKVSTALFDRRSVSTDRVGNMGLATMLRSRTMAEEGASSMPVVNVHVAEASSGALEDRRAAEEGLIRRHKLAELEEMGLRNKETFLNALAATNRQIEKLVAVSAFCWGSASMSLSVRFDFSHAHLVVILVLCAQV
jgi:CPW-WPC domain-containing protein